MKYVRHLCTMTHAQLRQWFYAQLSSVYLQGELQSMYHWCVREIHEWSRVEAYAHNDDVVEPDKEKRWKSVCEELQDGVPIQYIFGKAPFFDLELSVSPAVLIPRPETEELVCLVLDKHDEKTLTLLDVGTGSGCIPIAVKRERPNWRVIGLDVSAEALKVAEQNAKDHNYDIEWICADVANLTMGQLVDVVVSNPPYIPTDRRNTLESNVVEHEPHLALFSPEGDPFYFFNIIAEKAVDAGVRHVYFETHATEVDELITQLSNIWPGTVSTVKDLSGKERFVVLNTEY